MHGMPIYTCAGPLVLMHAIRVRLNEMHQQRASMAESCSASCAFYTCQSLDLIGHRCLYLCSDYQAAACPCSAGKHANAIQACMSWPSKQRSSGLHVLDMIRSLF